MTIENAYINKLEQGEYLVEVQAHDKTLNKKIAIFYSFKNETELNKFKEENKHVIFITN